MTSIRGGHRWWRVGSAAAAIASGLTFCAAPAFAQTEAAQGAASENLTVNLMRLLVKQHVITQEAADQLMAQAQRETAEARAAAASQAPIATNLPPVAPGATRIPYVPEIVKNQIRDEVRQEVIQQAKAENWAQPNQVPAWTKHIQISGDVRVRSQSDLYSKNNTTDLINFAALNANGPTDINSYTNPGGIPFLDTQRDRLNQLSIRARLDILATPSPWVSADIRLASGQSNSPVSTTQALGGGLTKKSIWLDRAYIDLHPAPWIGASAGRMPNPFFSTDLVYDDDLNFDGAAARGSFDIWPSQGLSLSSSGGAFLIDSQDANFPSNSDQKAGSKIKWMFGAQVAANWKTERFNWRTGLAYYQFQYDRGLLSAPCALYAGVKQCSTDFTAPAFMQKGNTLFLIRDIVADPKATAGTTAIPQYAGLMFDYNILNLTSSFDLKLGEKHLVLVGDYARNLAYRHQDACRYGEAGLPVTNVLSSSLANTDPCIAGSPARFKSGPNAWMLKATYGDLEPYRFGQWNFTAGFKHIAPDAVIDAYNDSDFHLGGTNAKGYFLAATVGLLEGANLQFRWFSADEVFGAPLAIDVGQIDLNVRF
ncbi:MAG: putative porin [Caulobacteraceae bacterium]|nr:putative porin [Caulobacteraceae bacterium]